jgi:hypothetical protein
MKLQIIFLLAIVFTFNVNAQNTDASKQYFQDAKTQLENMLSDKEKPNYEKAVFTIENAWYENQVDKVSFDEAMNKHLEAIRELIKNNYDEKAIKQKPNLLITQQEIKNQYKQALTNWAIYTYITSPILFVDNKDTNTISFHRPYKYSTSDPMATTNWENSQVVNLNNTHQGNCFALASMFKILSDRLNSEATLCTAPSHIYISHKDDKGADYNIELGSKYFPGTGMISALTYTTDQAIRNGISQKKLNTQQAIALCLVYLAKGYEHKFTNTSDEFILECANTAIQYDPKNLNALLLKSEYLENKLIAQKKSIAQLQTQTDFKEYQTLITNLYALGYREMPLEMKNTLVKTYKHEPINKELPKFQTDKGKFATLSWGIFDERHTHKPTERIGNTIFNTKTKQIASFTKDQTLYNNYNFDPVVFAWNIDPLFKKYPNSSPYAFCLNSPIAHFDPDGQDLVYFNLKGQELGRIASKTEFRTFIQTGNFTIPSLIAGKVFSEVPMPKIITSKDNTNTTTAEYQQYDYIIAAETGIFNYNKNNGNTPTHSNGKTIDDPSSVPDLDPTLVKATAMQETEIGTVDHSPNDLNNAKTDIMQANVYYSAKSNDWGDHKLQFGLTKGGGATPQQSIKAGIGLMYQKGLRTVNGATSWIGGNAWQNASNSYNGGGASNYGNVLKMQSTAVKPQPSNYTTSKPPKRK